MIILNPATDGVVSRRIPESSMMKTKGLSIFALPVIFLGLVIHAVEFSPDLGMPFELIDGGIIQEINVPPDAEELNRYPLPLSGTRELLSEVPHKPFREVSPPPRSREWWKYPVYLVLGFPRDALDTVMGVMAHVPIVSPLAVYPVYEVIPTQAVFRDPRDWHDWPGARNSRGHGMVDSESWGWFPSARSWKFDHVSEAELQEYHEQNELLTGELNRLNREIEVENQRVSGLLRQARRIALDAVSKGDGGEALSRMLPYWYHHDLDQGAFALFITSLGLYAEEGPDWPRPLLWKELSRATTGELVRAESVLARTHERFPTHPVLAEALIYIQLHLGKNDAAVETAEIDYQAQPAMSSSPMMVFETAMSAQDTQMATEAWNRTREFEMGDDVRQLGMARLEMIRGHPDEMSQLVKELLSRDSENPYLYYFLGVAELELALGGDYRRAAFETAFEHLEKAAFTAPGYALRTRAGKALSYARTLLDEISRNPGGALE
jgi:tetratricopeptide (TPR) repeat protein